MILIRSAGPLYWASEYPVSQVKDVLPDQRRVTYSWFVEDDEPYRKSIWGFRVRFTESYAIHVGVCKTAEEPPHKGLVHITPGDIGAWGRRKEDGDAVPEETTSDSL